MASSRAVEARAVVLEACPGFAPEEESARVLRQVDVA